MSPVVEKIVKHWWGLRTAHQAVMLDDAQKVLKQNREQNQQHSQTMVCEGKTMKQEEEDAIHVGDKIQHFHGRQSGNGSGWLKPALIGAALLGGGAAAGIGLSQLLGRLERVKETTIERKLQLDPAEYEFDFSIKDGRIEMGSPRRVDPEK